MTKMKIAAVGTRVFVTGLRLAGIQGHRVDSSAEALAVVNRLMKDKEVGLIIVGDDISREIRAKLNELRSRNPSPLIYEVPAPGSRKEKFEYRDMLKQILGV